MTLVEPPCTPCVPWETDVSCCEDWDELDPALQLRGLDLAWSTLRTLTGGRVGACPVLVRPCVPEPCDWCTGQWLNPVIVDGRWVNRACGAPGCWCERVCEVVMPGPVAMITEVWQDGVSLELGGFRVDNGHRIVRTDGACFPACQNLDRPLSAGCTFGIAYVPGIVPSSAGLWAAGVLACEYAKACAGAKCRLPSNVTTIARQGVSMTMGTGLFPDNVTGIREVDAFVFSVNPNALRIPSTVWSPDVPWARHRYETLPGLTAVPLAVVRLDPDTIPMGDAPWPV
ncbi:MAG TPA: hypothetical protein VIX41_06130, partial [Acidimicrobiales bacterium]